MASQGDRSAISIISVIHGAVRILLNEKRFSRLDIQEDLESFNVQVATVRDRYCPGYTEKDISWTLMALDKWGADLEKLELPEELQTAALVKVASMALDDLLIKVSNKKKLASLKSLEPTLTRCMEFVDHDGRGFSSFETADQILASLYKLIKFRP